MRPEMIEVHPVTPQPRLIAKIVETIAGGGVVVYPTDSGYAVGCALENKKGMDRICQIRKIDKYHNFTLVCSDLSELSNYAVVSDTCFRLMRKHTPGQYTFILQATKEVPRRLMNEKRKTIGLRVPDFPITQAILSGLHAPVMSTSLILPGNDVPESDPEEIEEKIGKSVDLIIDGGILAAEPTTVIDMADGEIKIIREGSGDTAPFLA